MTLAAELRGNLPLRPAGLLTRPADLLAARRLAGSLPTDGSGRGGPRGVRRTFSDLLVFRLDGRTGTPVLVKHPRSPRAIVSLTQEAAAVRQLEEDERLGAWRRLLPSVELSRLDGPLPLVVERLLPGMEGDALLRRSPRLGLRMAEASLDAMCQLHRATATTEDITARLGDWVDGRLAILREGVPWCRTGRGAPAMALLRDRLVRALTGRTLPVGWTHGDFHPGNVLLTPERVEPLGVIDWAGAFAHGPCVLDCHTFVLTLRHQREGRQLGRVVADVVRRDALLPEDRRLLTEAGVPAADAAEETALALLTWLWHVAGNVAKSARYGRSRRWVADNIVVVLDEVAARQARDARYVRPA